MSKVTFTDNFTKKLAEPQSAAEVLLDEALYEEENYFQPNTKAVLAASKERFDAAHLMAENLITNANALIKQAQALASYAKNSERFMDDFNASEVLCNPFGNVAIDAECVARVLRSSLKVLKADMYALENPHTLFTLEEPTTPTEAEQTPMTAEERAAYIATETAAARNESLTPTERLRHATNADLAEKGTIN